MSAPPLSKGAVRDLGLALAAVRTLQTRLANLRTSPSVHQVEQRETATRWARDYANDVERELLSVGRTE